MRFNSVEEAIVWYCHIKTWVENPTTQGPFQDEYEENRYIQVPEDRESVCPFCFKKDIEEMKTIYNCKSCGTSFRFPYKCDVPTGQQHFSRGNDNEDMFFWYSIFDSAFNKLSEFEKFFLVRYYFMDDQRKANNKMKAYFKNRSGGDRWLQEKLCEIDWKLWSLLDGVGVDIHEPQMPNKIKKKVNRELIDNKKFFKSFHQSVEDGVLLEGLKNGETIIEIVEKSLRINPIK